MRLFHVSEEADIEVFEPRVPYRKDIDDSAGLVWAISEERLHNYLFPRDCPRISCYPVEQTDVNDIIRIIGPSSANSIVAVESKWMPEILRKELYIYEFDVTNFELQDACAGYYVSKELEEPIAVTKIDNILEALLNRDIELRIMPSLWGLRDEVVDSTLNYSCIRMGYATPRDVTEGGQHE